MLKFERFSRLLSHSHNDRKSGKKAPCFNSAALSHVGKVRASNEDSYYRDDAQGVWIVADGMGGHSHGKTASQMACAVVSEELAKGNDMQGAVNTAHQSIQQLAVSMGAASGMGTTFVAITHGLSAKKEFPHLDIWWLGDSRAYLHQEDSLKLLTHDHSVVQELIDANLISSEEAQTHRQSHVITRALGIKHKSASSISNTFTQLAHRQVNYEAGTSFMLCSDGLTRELSESDISAVLASSSSLDHKAQTLVDMANANGGNDNITVLLIKGLSD